ncbi:O-antigen ligase [Hypnocyclicus thermotrophus]|uniref:O-antigen ligase n=1 Tax=Hypnocyclicus thermotrophus TaxID=1627895 RepID=A0AA46DZ96_9FUSO|nr:O-antigen ligase family protein [Hypnocyclicus thermotrophus]TDT70615.1 O-antigen ligase [Hypnocyclicus thermotrophus]
MKNLELNKSFSNSLIKIGTIILYVFILSIFSSKALSNITASLLLITTIIYILINKFNIKIISIAKFGIILYLLGFVINIFNQGGYPNYLGKYYYFLVPFVVYLYIDIKNIKKIIYFLEIGLLINLIYGFFTFKNINQRFMGFFGPGREGDILVFVLIFNFSLIIFKTYNHIKTLNYLIFINTILSFIGLLLTKSRGSWIGFFVAIIIFILLSKNKKVLLIFILSLSLVVIGDYTLNNQRIVSRIKSISNTKTDISNISRLQMWNIAKGVIAEDLFIGAGRKNIPIKMKEYYYRQNKEFQEENKYGIKFGTNVHNNFLQILIDLGLIFFILFIIFILYITNSIFNRIKSENIEQKSIEIGILSGIVGFYFTQIFHTEFFTHGAYLFYFFITLAYIFKEEEKIKVSLVVSVYKNIDYLDLIFMSLEKQVYKNFEVIVAEDNDSQEMKDFIKKSQEKYNFEIKHVNQEDKGFRKNKILNKAIKKAEGSYVIFIDGDCVLHNKFIYQYVKNIKENYVLFGRRTHISEKLTKKVVKTKNISLLSLPVILFTDCKRKEEAFYIPFITSRRKSGVYGCNFMVSKKDLYEVNGFDEEYEGPYYGEDKDLETRLRLKGVKFNCIKRKVIQYHLYHEKVDREEKYKKNKKIYERKIKEEKYYCDLGIKKN